CGHSIAARAPAPAERNTGKAQAWRHHCSAPSRTTAALGRFWEAVEKSDALCRERGCTAPGNRAAAAWIQTVEVERSSVDFIIALDLSRSMLAEDLEGKARLGVGKTGSATFLCQLRGARGG